MLAQRYDIGDGVDQSYQQARELYELSASQGHATAQGKLGDMYENGHGVDQSYERAREYYEAAARQGHAYAQYSLGVLYYNGQGVEQSNEIYTFCLLRQGNSYLVSQRNPIKQLESRTKKLLSSVSHKGCKERIE